MTRATESYERDLKAAQAEVRRLQYALEFARDNEAAHRRQVDRLTALLNTPIIDDFVRGVTVEAAHQVDRWGIAHDAVKSPSDWFWTLGHLSGKALQAALAGDGDKLRHHLITSAALLANWHRHALASDDDAAGA